MKKITILLLLILISTAGIFLTMPDKKEIGSQEKEEIVSDLVVGATYLRTRDDKRDPFDRVYNDTLVILDIKNGYAKFTKKERINDTAKLWFSSPVEYLNGLERIE